MEATITELEDTYPDITWSLVEPSDEILKNFGDGTILRGEFEDRGKEFFILADDENKFRWGVVIAHYLFNMQPIEEK